MKTKVVINGAAYQGIRMDFVDDEQYCVA
ncbi:hypothetical protein FORC93_1145 [Salmonella enterica subsp. enterica serovar Braenderup]|nr:hypothetical protein FORC93_1145 [Salmonella enterica subsp. enterica serovar Braenderup]